LINDTLGPIGKRLFGETSQFGVTKFLRQSVAIILLPIYTRFLPISEFGIIALAQSALLIYISVFDLGLRSVLTRYYHDYQENSQELNKLIGTIVFITFISALTSLLILFLWGQYIFRIFGKELELYPDGLLLVLTGVAGLFFQLRLTFEQVSRNARKFLFLSIAEMLFSTSLIFVFIIWYKSAFGIMVAWCISAIVFGIISIIFFLHHFHPTISLISIQKSLKFGLPFVPHALSSTAGSIVSRILINRWINISAVAIYSIGERIISPLDYITIAFNSAWSPFYFAEMARDKQKCPENLARLSEIYFSFLLVIGAFLFVFINEAILLLAGSKYLTAVLIGRIMIFMPIFSGIYYLNCQGIWYANRTGIFPILSIILTSLMLLLYLFYIPQAGIIAAAIIRTVISALLAFITYIISQKLSYIPYHLKSIFRVIAMVFLICILSILIELLMKILLLIIILKLIIFTTGVFFILRKNPVFIMGKRYLLSKIGKN